MKITMELKASLTSGECFTTKAEGNITYPWDESTTGYEMESMIEKTTNDLFQKLRDASQPKGSPDHNPKG